MTLCVLVLVMTSDTERNRRDGKGNALLVLDLSGSIQFFTNKVDVSCRFFVDALVRLRKFQFIPRFLITFIMNEC